MGSGAFVDIPEFIESCRKVYFATEDYTIVTFIIVNAGLYYLFREKTIENQSRGLEHSRYQNLCRDNLETALANLLLLLPATAEAVEALLFGVSEMLFLTTWGSVSSSY
jgi:hypothetical protein